MIYTIHQEEQSLLWKIGGGNADVSYMTKFDAMKVAWALMNLDYESALDKNGYLPPSSMYTASLMRIEYSVEQRARGKKLGLTLNAKAVANPLQTSSKKERDHGYKTSLGRGFDV